MVPSTHVTSPGTARILITFQLRTTLEFRYELYANCAPH